MNRSRWLTWGFGMLFIGLVVNSSSSYYDCSYSRYRHIMGINAFDLEKKVNIEDINKEIKISKLMIACLKRNMYINYFSLIIDTLAIVFIIIGFIKPNNEHKT